MRFYHNSDINVTAEENWVVDYLMESGQVENRDEAYDNLRGLREFCGWYECGVSDTIEEVMRYAI